MSEVQETGTSRKIEHIEKSQSSSSKTRKLYVLGVAFVAVLLLGTSFGMMLSATTPSIPTVIEPGSMVSGYSYIIFKDGATTYAKNGTTGAMSFSSTVSFSVIQYAVNAVGNASGGSIYLAAATYSGTTEITLSHDDLTFVGAGFGTHIYISAMSGPQQAIYVGGNHILIRDLYIQGPGKSAPGTPYHAIAGTSVNNVTVENVYASDFTDDQIIFHGPNTEWITVRGCYVWNCDEGIEVKGGQHILFDGNFVDTDGQSAIEISDRSVGNFDNDVNDVIVTNNHIRSNAFGVFIYGNVTRLLISNNIIDKCSSSIFAVKSGATEGLADQILITNNIINNSLNYGIQFYEPSTNVVISNNLIKNSGTAGILANANNQYWVVDENEISNSAYGIRWLAGTWENALISNNYIHDMSQYGIHVNVAGKNMTISNNYILNADSGIRGSAYIYSLSIRGNTIVKMTTLGISMYATTANIAITDNTINNAPDALKLWGSYNLIDGNFFSNTSDAGIWIVSGSYNMITSNRFAYCSYGIYSDGSSDYNTIAFNLFKSSTTALSLAGTNNVLVNNTAV